MDKEMQHLLHLFIKILVLYRSSSSTIQADRSHKLEYSIDENLNWIFKPLIEMHLVTHTDQSAAFKRH